ncbi:MAG: hypothetical protein WC455_24750 [Dehalococcoidia bacterium]|jgi:hypothetical protein
MKLRQWSVKKMVTEVKNHLSAIRQIVVVVKNHRPTVRQLVLTGRIASHAVLSRTAHLRCHVYANTGISINKMDSDRYAGDVLRCERCDRVRVVLSDEDYPKAISEKGCVGFKSVVVHTPGMLII